jgi:hypothetical protein
MQAYSRLQTWVLLLVSRFKFNRKEYQPKSNRLKALDLIQLQQVQHSQLQALQVARQILRSLQTVLVLQLEVLRVSVGLLQDQPVLVEVQAQQVQEEVQAQQVQKEVQAQQLPAAKDHRALEDLLVEAKDFLEVVLVTQTGHKVDHKTEVRACLVIQGWPSQDLQVVKWDLIKIKLNKIHKINPGTVQKGTVLHNK